MTVIVIGHGESPLGLEWGSRIDEHTVIRLKDPSWQKSKDYGRRTDYMVSSTETMMVMLQYTTIPKEYFAQPKRGTWSKDSERNFRREAKAPLRIPIEIHEKWNAVFRAMACDTQSCPNHSVGMAAITYAAQLLEAQEILLVGFDNMLDPERLDYFKANKGRWPSRHEWVTENAMLPLIEKEYGCVIRGFR